MKRRVVIREEPRLAVKLAGALTSTTDRYRRGFIVQSTWRTHMDHLWAKALHAGLYDEVYELVRLTHA